MAHTATGRTRHTIAPRTAAVLQAIRDNITSTQEIAQATGYTKDQVQDTLSKAKQRGYVQHAAGWRAGTAPTWELVPGVEIPRVRQNSEELVDDGIVLRARAQHSAQVHGRSVWPKAQPHAFEVDSLGRVVYGRRRYGLTQAEDRARQAMVAGSLSHND